MEGLVSIIITTYNRSGLLIEAVNSCLAQSYPNIEVIVVDDGSKDDTAKRMESYQQDPRVIYHYKENGERAAARNTGIQLARGQYLKFMDSDDLIDPGYVSMCVKYFEANAEAGLLHTNCKLLHDDGTMAHTPKKGISGNVFETLWDFNDISLSSTMLRRNTHERWGGFDETRSLSGAEDWEYWVRLAKQGCQVGFVTAFITTIRIHQENGTMNDIDRIVFSTREGQRLLNEKFEIAPALNHRLNVRLTYLKAVYDYINGNRGGSLRHLFKAAGQSKKLLLKSDFWMLWIKNFFPKGITVLAKKVLKK